MRHVLALKDQKQKTGMFNIHMTGGKVLYHKEISYSNNFPIFFKIPKFTSIWEHVVNNGLLSFDELIRKNV